MKFNTNFLRKFIQQEEYEKLIIEKGLSWFLRRLGVKKEGSVKELDKRLYQEILNRLLNSEEIFIPEGDFEYERDKLLSEDFFEEWIDDTAELVIQEWASDYRYILSRAKGSKVKIVDDYDCLLDGDDEEELMDGVLLWVCYQILKDRYDRIRGRLLRNRKVKKKYLELVEKSYIAWKELEKRMREMIREGKSVREILSKLRAEYPLDLVAGVLKILLPSKRDEIEYERTSLLFNLG